MNTNHFFRHRSDIAPRRDERRPAGLNEAQAIARKALERWEYEGGRIPELTSGNGRDAPARAERG
jgi:hypothetical protein